MGVGRLLDIMQKRFWNNVQRNGECWEWTASTQTQGYGQTTYSGRRWLAHRVAYELMVGPIPEGLTLDHLCRNRICVRPGHLEAVTNRENVLRGEGTTAVNARKTQCDHGHPYTPENTYTRQDGTRECRTCRRRAK